MVDAAIASESWTRGRDLAVRGHGIVGCGLGPILFGAITNVIVDGTTGADGMDWDLLWTLLGVQTVIYLVVACLTFAQGQMLTIAVQRSVAGLRTRIEDKVHRLPLRYFESTTAACSSASSPRTPTMPPP